MEEKNFSSESENENETEMINSKIKAFYIPRM